MELQIRNQGGRKTLNHTAIETRLVLGETKYSDIFSCVHTIEVVNGNKVLLGSNTEPGTYLHFKGQPEDYDDDGIIDYTNTNIFVTHEGHGESVIKVEAKIILNDGAHYFIESNELTVEWMEDLDGEWV